MPKKKTHEEFIKEISEKHPDITILGRYVNSNTRIRVRHECGYEWETMPQSLCQGHGCPKCGKSIKKSCDEFKAEMLEINQNIDIIGDYVSCCTPIKCHCKKCDNEFSSLPINLLRGHGCPVCTGKKVVIGYNDIATVAPQIIPYFADQSDIYKYTPCSHEKALVRCPDCGYEKMITIKSLYTQGFGCQRCGDGISYPNKFARGLLSQLPIDNLQFEFSPDWANKKRYDNYFEYEGEKYIVEMDGMFHFKDNKMSGQTAKQSKEIDNEKDMMAIQHGIKVIRIDATVSSKSYLMNSILNSELSNALDLSNVDWDLCAITATKNYAKTVSEYYEENKYKIPIQQIADDLKISLQALYKYRKIGASFGWCCSDQEDNSLVRSLNTKHPNAVRVHVSDLSGNIIGDFNSCNGAAKYLSKITGNTYCGGSVYDSLKKNNTTTYKGYVFTRL